MYEKMRGGRERARKRERQNPGLVFTSSVTLTPGTAQSPYLGDEGISGRLHVCAGD